MLYDVTSYDADGGAQTWAGLLHADARERFDGLRLGPAIPTCIEVLEHETRTILYRWIPGLDT